MKTPGAIMQSLLLVIATISSFSPLISASSQPHIVVIIADDLGWNDVSFHGSDQIPTPNIDALASNGVIMNRYYVQPTCTPSRTAYLTGRYPLRDGMQGIPLMAGERWGIPLGRTLLSEHLRNLGYTTRLVGKWHVGYYSVDHTPTHRGFDSFFGFYNGFIKYFDHTISHDDNTTGYDIHRDTPQILDVELNREYFTDVITKEVEELIGSHDTSKPLYLQVAQLAPHSGDLDKPLEVWNETEVNKTFGYIEDINRRKYAGMVARLDYSVGRIVRAVKTAGMLEKSIVIFFSDNGAPTEGFLENFGSNYPLRGLKGSMFDGGVRAAACIYSPLLNVTSRVSEELMHITDWMPTLYSAAGGNVSDLGEIDGLNQWPTLKNGEGSPRDSVILNIDEVANVTGTISGNYKLLTGRQRVYPYYYGDSGVRIGYPSYNATSVIDSDAGQGIAGISNNSATVETILAMRGLATRTCPSFDAFYDCSTVCLFDMIKDPCETIDIRRQFPEIVDRMKNLTDPCRAVLLPQSSSTFDPTSDPSNFGGVWMPWVVSSSTPCSPERNATGNDN